MQGPERAANIAIRNFPASRAWKTLGRRKQKFSFGHHLSRSNHAGCESW